MIYILYSGRRHDYRRDGNGSGLGHVEQLPVCQ
jgi:hypothetical protein